MKSRSFKAVLISMVVWGGMTAAIVSGQSATDPAPVSTPQPAPAAVVPVAPAVADTLSPEDLSPAAITKLLHQTYRQAVSRVAPAVVSLKVIPRTAQPGDAGKTFSIGSGCIIHPEGYIITSNHLVKDAHSIMVSLSDGRQYLSAGIWCDPDTDLAIVHILPGKEALPLAPWGDSDAVCVGDPVMAIGSPFGLNQTVTSGIISSKGRQTPTQILGEWGFEDFLQTDAVTNQGSSGGPLINLYGQVIGINANILTPTGYSTGYGFAVPSNLASWVADELRQYKQIKRGYLGAALLPGKLIELQRRAAANALELQEAGEVLQKVPADLQGVMVARVTQGSPAREGGMRPYDIITRVDDQMVTDSLVLREYIARHKPGTRINLSVWRKGETVRLPVTLASRQLAPVTAAAAPQPVVADTAPAVTPQSVPAEPAISGKLGITIKILDEELATLFAYPPDQTGIIIVSVTPDSLAERCGLKPGMIIQKVNGKNVPGDLAGRDLVRQLVAHLNYQRPELKLVVQYKTVTGLEIEIK